MSITDYIKNLNRLKKSAVDRWGNMTTVEQQVFDASYEWLTDNLELKRGAITVDESLPGQMDSFLQAVMETIQESKPYQSKLNRFLADLNTIQNNNKLFHSTTNNFNIETAGVTEVQKTVVNEVLKQYKGNGLNAHFAAPLRDGIFRNILAGADLSDVREVLKVYIISEKDESGKLGQYLEQTAVQAVDSYTGAINQQLVEEFEFTGYVISGSLIATSSKQCVYAVETGEDGYLSFPRWEEVLEIARNNPKAKLIEGTTIKNLPLQKLHWNCRHDFTPLIKV